MRRLNLIIIVTTLLATITSAAEVNSRQKEVLELNMQVGLEWALGLNANWFSWIQPLIRDKKNCQHLTRSDRRAIKSLIEEKLLGITLIDLSNAESSAIQTASFNGDQGLFAASAAKLIGLTAAFYAESYNWIDIPAKARDCTSQDRDPRNHCLSLETLREMVVPSSNSAAGKVFSHVINSAYENGFSDNCYPSALMMDIGLYSKATNSGLLAESGFADSKNHGYPCSSIRIKGVGTTSPSRFKIKVGSSRQVATSNSLADFYFRLWGGQLIKTNMSVEQSNIIHEKILKVMAFPKTAKWPHPNSPNLVRTYSRMAKALIDPNSPATNPDLYRKSGSYRTNGVWGNIDSGLVAHKEGREYILSIMCNDHTKPGRCPSSLIEHITLCVDEFMTKRTNTRDLISR